MNIIRKQMVDLFKEYLLQEEKSKATIEKYIYDVNCFYLYLQGKNSVSKSDAIGYKAFLMERYKPASVSSKLTALNHFFQFLNWQDCKVKGIKIQRKIFCSEEKELTKKEYERLLTAAFHKKDKRLYYIIQTICATGIRISELKFITVQGLTRGRIEVNCKGKFRTIFVPSRLRKELLKFAAKDGRKNGLVFVSNKGNAVNRSNVWTQMKKLCEKAKVASEKVFPHNLRHLFASTFYKMKKDLVKLADILGHSSIETTRIYTITTGKEHERQINSLGLLVL